MDESTTDNDTSNDMRLIPVLFVGHEGYHAVYTPRGSGKGDTVLLPAFACPSWLQVLALKDVAPGD